MPNYTLSQQVSHTDDLHLQRYFSGMAASPLAHESKDKIKDVLSSILGSAVQYGLLVKNPVEGIRLPADKKRKEEDQAARYPRAVRTVG